MKLLVTSIVDLANTSHNRLHEFVRYLCPHHEITVISVNDWWKAGQVGTVIYRQGFEDLLSAIKIKYLTGRRLNPSWQELFSPLFLSGILGEIDCASFDVHLNYNTLVSGYYVAKRLKVKGINTVYDLADDLPAMVGTSPQINPVLRPMGKVLSAMMLRRNVAMAAKTTVTTPYLQERYNVPRERSEIIPNGVDCGLFHLSAAVELKRQLGLDDCFVAGYVGVLREWVDLEPVMAALSRLRRNGTAIKMLVVGAEGGLEKNQGLAARYGLSGDVVFTGTIPYPRVPEYISVMDVCLLPYRADAPAVNAFSPLKMLEYLACAKPVIASRITGAPLEFKDKVLYAATADEYADVFLKLYHDIGLRQRMGAEGRRLVEQGYSWSASARKMEEALMVVKRQA